MNSINQFRPPLKRHHENILDVRVFGLIADETYGAHDVRGIEHLRTLPIPTSFHASLDFFRCEEGSIHHAGADGRNFDVERLQFEAEPVRVAHHTEFGRIVEFRTAKTYFSGD